MNKLIWKAIIDKYKASTTLKTALPGGMHLLSHPQQTAKGDKDIYPYCVIIPIASVKDYTFKEAADDLEVQFSIWDDSSSVATINDAADALKTVYDFASLSLSGYNHIVMQQLYSELMKEEDYFHQVITYQLIIQKAR